MFRGSSCIRNRSHGPLPVPTHDNIALWSDHSLSFDIPSDQTDKVTIITEIILKAKATDATSSSSSMLISPASPSLLPSSPPIITVDRLDDRGEREEEEERGGDGEDNVSVTEEKGLCVIRRRLGRVVLGSDAVSDDGRRQWNEAIDSSRQEVLYWHPLY